STGVKGVINDARHYETTRRNKWANVIRSSILSLHGMHINGYIGSSRLRGNDAKEIAFSSSPNVTDETFLEWCASRRRSLESEANSTIYCTKKDRPSGETSATIESALLPIVKKNTAIHYVKIYYETMEFDQAAAPAILVYKNQGDLLANLTGFTELVSDHTFSSDVLEQLLKNATCQSDYIR
ncbi:hypothetical protein S40285_09785, partial [Stachybotrys chlorohalonatus IBT 40285]